MLDAAATHHLTEETPFDVHMCITRQERLSAVAIASASCLVACETSKQSLHNELK